MKTFLIKYLFLFVIFAGPVSAQTNPVVTDTVYKTNIFETNFFNDVNSANFNSILNFKKKFGRYGFSLSNSFLSNVSKLDRKYFRDLNNLKLILSYSIQKNLDAGLGFQNKFYTDDRSAETNQNKSSFYFVNLDAGLKNSIFLNGKIGLKTEDQIGEFNAGPSGIIEAQALNYNFNQYLTNGNLVLFYEHLNEKKNHNFEINLDIYKRFASEVDNTGSIRFYNQKNDFYFPASPGIMSQYDVRNNIERRNENYFLVGDNLNYGITDELILTFGGSYQNKVITREYKYKPPSSSILFENTYDNKIIENKLEVYSELNFNRRNIYSRLRIMLSERSENHSLINEAGLSSSQISELEKAEKNKNNNSRRTSLLFNVFYPVSNTNSFSVTGSLSLLRYDTDFLLNYDDRDETESIFSASHLFNNLYNFNAETRFEVILSGLSYIYSQRSANNYKNKIYRLISISNFKPTERLITKNYFQVLANYTVYDFEDLISQIQSFSYRQLSIRDSSTYNLGRGFNLKFSGELKFYEQGEFLNNTFSVKPISFFAEQFYLPEINYLISNILNLGIGYKYFSQDRYNYDETEKQLANTYQSFGPVGKAEMYLNKNSSVKFIIGLDRVKFLTPPQSSSSVNFQLNILWNM
ncbi:MAG: hypothetical protein JSS91_02560 [Bacteroidetes bacterium]|nr:hypothetical protein [Bacteroidota bacterium]